MQRRGYGEGSVRRELKNESSGQYPGDGGPWANKERSWHQTRGGDSSARAEALGGIRCSPVLNISILG